MVPFTKHTPDSFTDDNMVLCYNHITSRDFQHTHYFILIMGVGKRGAYESVHGDLPRQHPFGTTLRFTGPVPADSRQ